jgi:hypothetical protein
MCTRECSPSDCESPRMNWLRSPATELRHLSEVAADSAKLVSVLHYGATPKPTQSRFTSGSRSLDRGSSDYLRNART